MQAIKAKWIAKGIVFGIAAISALTFITMFLWNNLATAIFGLPVIGFFQALGLMVLGRLLTGGFGSRGWRGGSGFNPRHRHMRERWKSMSEEERAQFTQRWGRHRCGPEAAEKQTPEAGETTA